MNKQFINLTDDHLPIIRKLIIDNVQIKSTSIDNKIIINCPYCQDIKFHGIINLTWNNYYCFKCKESKNIFKYLKDIDLLDECYYEISRNLNLDHYNISKYINSLIIKEYKEKEKTDESNISNFTKFIQDHNLLHISEVPSAYEYSLKRTSNDVEEINNYFVDENYIYIPIINNYEVSHIIGRKYNDFNKLYNLPRYYNLSQKDILKYGFNKPSESFPFLDNIVSNPKTNILYITEGYFDSYSVNKSMGDYISTSLLGKNLSLNGLNILKNNFSKFTKIMILLDSIEKDKGNIHSILNLHRLLQKYFIDINIIILKHSDPNELFTSFGSNYLRLILKKESYESYKIHDYELQFESYISKGFDRNVNFREFILGWK